MLNYCKYWAHNDDHTCLNPLLSRKPCSQIGAKDCYMKQGLLLATKNPERFTNCLECSRAYVDADGFKCKHSRTVPCPNNSKRKASKRKSESNSFWSFIFDAYCAFFESEPFSNLRWVLYISGIVLVFLYCIMNFIDGLLSASAIALYSVSIPFIFHVAIPTFLGLISDEFESAYEFWSNSANQNCNDSTNRDRICHVFPVYSREQGASQFAESDELSVEDLARIVQRVHNER